MSHHTWRLILDYIDVLRWPVVVLVALVLFKKPLTRLIDRTRTWSGFGMAAEWDEAVKHVQEVVPAVPMAQPEGELQVAKVKIFSIDELGEISGPYRNGVIVWADLSALDQELASRVLYFCAGLASATDGRINFHPSRAVRLTPGPRP